MKICWIGVPSWNMKTCTKDSIIQKKCPRSNCDPYQSFGYTYRICAFTFHLAPPQPCRLVPLLKSSHIMRNTYLKNLPHDSGSWYTVRNCLLLLLLGDMSCTPGSSHGDHRQEDAKARHDIFCRDFPIPSHRWHCLW